MEKQQHYSLKWNNHPNNISSVFSRLRDEQLFTDVTLATADRQCVQAHRVVLSAGSPYLDTIFAGNPSDHPTLVLSNIRYKQLKLILDFMYTGEISIDEAELPTLLEAASWLQIKGLCENRIEEQNNPEPLLTPAQLVKPALYSHHHKQNHQKSQSEINPKKRKRSFVDRALDDQIDVDKTQEISPKKSFVTKEQACLPLVGVTNTGWLLSATKQVDKNNEMLSSEAEAGSCTSSSPTSTVEDKDDDAPLLLNLSTDRRNLLNHLKVENACSSSVQESMVQQAALYSSSPQHAQQMMQAMQTTYLSQLQAVLQQSSAAAAVAQLQGSFTAYSTNNATSQQYHKFTGVLNSAPVRRYKQYTEANLHAALKEIMEGQSINRSSMKHNIPARTLRDWMKRLNIKSVFTHNKDSKEGSVGSTSPEPDLNVSLERLRHVFASVDENSDRDHTPQPLKIDEDCNKMSSVPVA